MLAMWSKARDLAQMAPPERNRWVDFLRAVSILAVVFGHWLMAGLYVDDAGELQRGDLLSVANWTHWLTWGFQVMPVFFLVGGFSNGMSWDATLRKSAPAQTGVYRDWLAARVQRLIAPTFPVLLLWAVLAVVMTQVGLERGQIRDATEAALIPVWFLSVYLVVTACTPLTRKAWERFGWLSFAIYIPLAMLTDWLTFSVGVPYVNFTNFLWVFLAIHQLGFAWRDGRFDNRLFALATFVVGLAILISITVYGFYPVSMVSAPGGFSNSLPPTLALFALGVTQVGLVLALEPLGRKMLDNLSIWSATVLMNGMIMTVYLWHLTAFVLVMTVMWIGFGGAGLSSVPGTGEWWASRPLWLGVYILALLPMIAIFAKHERSFGPIRGGRTVPKARVVAGVFLICAGLAATAGVTITSEQSWSGINLIVVAAPFVGAALLGFGPMYKWFSKTPAEEGSGS
ncbi:acyltransferase family protein [Erythrobacter crassostreae]|uniref:Acyltransferase n=1 Tax=Erythrobacter crassostreae TaxID=2828328 RepID=A0A9X1F5Q4_9SPHN|nr:acyltransferase [Erythrobacter crassostrea]MBV7260389.1 acyltransferase [Erythrobacter crassostrea]